MPDSQAPRAEAGGAVPSTAVPTVSKQKLAAVESFLGAFIKSAKTISLYKEGHEMIIQIVGRVANLLRTSLANEPNMTIDVKSKNLLYEEAVLEETEELVSFAAILHVLGIGQIVFSDRITDEGMLRFMKMITERPDLKRSLSDMQRDVQKTRIDGLQLVSIMSFVETDDEVEQQTPGRLSEEQVAAFAESKTLPDFLYLLFRQNEPLTGKKADSLSMLFDEVMDREVSLEEFSSRMPWELYDPRIRARFEALAGEIKNRSKWNRDGLLSDLSILTPEDAAFKAGQKNLEAGKAFAFSLAETHAILDKPAGDKQPKYALFSYTRLLADMGRRGDLAGLLREVEIWRKMAADQKWAAYLAALRDEVQKRVPSRALAASVAAGLKDPEPESDSWQRIHDFILTVGRCVIAMLVEEMRSISDKAHRQKLCAMLAAVCRRFGPEDLFPALGDQDYFMVVLITNVLAEINMPGSAEKVAPLLSHSHAKVRGAAMQALRRFGGETAVRALGEFIVKQGDAAEAKLAVTSLSLVAHEGVGRKLVEAYVAREDYDIRVALVTALGRFGSPETLNFLNSINHFGFLDRLTGKNKELREALRASIAQVKKELGDGS